MSNNIPVLSHFTTFEAFKKILVSKALWVMPYQKMNDPAEGLIFNEYFLTYLRENHPDKLHHWQKLIHDWCSRNSPDELDNNIYLASFVSGEMDEYFLLNQWAQYAKDGCGVNIQFDFSHFFHNQEICAGISLSNSGILALPSAPAYLTKVTYLSGHSDPQIIPVFESIIQQESQKGEKNIVLENGQNISSVILSINRLRASIKQKSFSQEQEWRIVITEIPKDETRYFKKASCSIHGAGRYEIPIIYDNQSLLTSITLGPRFFEHYCIDCIKEVVLLLARLLSKEIKLCYKMIFFSRDISMQEERIKQLGYELKQVSDDLWNNFNMVYSENS